MDDFERKTLDDIERFGCSVMHILAEGDLPPFSYSVGITKTSAAPEVVVIGLTQQVAHAIINEYNGRVRAGEVFRAGERHAGFVKGFEVALVKVGEEFYREYFGYDIWLYEGTSFDVLQIVYPDRSGVWPWQAEANGAFRSRQPVLRGTQ